jgi:hypothetical protein
MYRLWVRGNFAYGRIGELNFKTYMLSKLGGSVLTLRDFLVVVYVDYDNSSEVASAVASIFLALLD